MQHYKHYKHCSKTGQGHKMNVKQWYKESNFTGQCTTGILSNNYQIPYTLCVIVWLSDGIPVHQVIRFKPILHIVNSKLELEMTFLWHIIYTDKINSQKRSDSTLVEVLHFSLSWLENNYDNKRLSQALGMKYNTQSTYKKLDYHKWKKCIKLHQ